MGENKLRRFYKAAQVSKSADGFGVLLDTRALRTPGGAVFCAPTQALAVAVAREWDSQGAVIVPASMPLTQIAFAALDGGEAARAERVAYVVKFGETDLCCHRADAPAALAAQQTATWDPLIAWGEEALDVRLPVVAGIIAAKVPGEALKRLRDRALALDDFRLTALAQATGLAGSALIAFALIEERLAAGQAYVAAALDDLWSLEHWGEDEEARARLERLRGDLEAVARFVACLSE
ncbi:MAG: ATPase [Hyphomonadaceae bacterium]|nr:ATPase [Hyphomonadaceae bacterium]